MLSGESAALADSQPKAPCVSQCASHEAAKPPTTFSCHPEERQRRGTCCCVADSCRWSTSLPPLSRRKISSNLPRRTEVAARCVETSRCFLTLIHPSHQTRFELRRSSLSGRSVASISRRKLTKKRSFPRSTQSLVSRRIFCVPLKRIRLLRTGTRRRRDSKLAV